MVENAGSDAAPGSEDVSLLSLLNVVLRRRRLIVLLPVIGGALAAGKALLQSRSYTASTSFLPQGAEMSQPRLSGLAAQLGFALGAGGQSADFYATLLTSREILREVSETRYELAPADFAWSWTREPARHSGTLGELLAVEGSSPELFQDRAMRALSDAMQVDVAGGTGIVSLEVTMPWPSLAENVTRHLLEAVSRFNLERRNTQAAAERKFVEGRLEEVREERAAAEGRLEAFLQRNREFRNSPMLVFQFERLEGEVNLQRQVQASLEQTYEQARIEEVRNTPVITVLEAPVPPARPNRRLLIFKGVLGILGGGMLALMWAFGAELFARSRERDADDAATFERLWAETRADVASLPGAARLLPGRRGRSAPAEDPPEPAS